MTVASIAMACVAQQRALEPASTPLPLHAHFPWYHSTSQIDARLQELGACVAPRDGVHTAPKTRLFKGFHFTGFFTLSKRDFRFKTVLGDPRQDLQGWGKVS